VILLLYRVVHFELLSQRPEETAVFYSEVFGWQRLQGPDGYWRLITGSGDERGINGASVGPLNDQLPAQVAVNTIEVPDLEQAIERIVRCGGRTLSEIIELNGAGRFAYCADPQDIAFGIIEYSRRS
jgi:uncharacterized protein